MTCNEVQTREAQARPHRGDVPEDSTNQPHSEPQPRISCFLGSQTHGEQTPHRVVHPCSGASGGRRPPWFLVEWERRFFHKREVSNIPFFRASLRPLCTSLK